MKFKLPVLALLTSVLAAGFLFVASIAEEKLGRKLKDNEHFVNQKDKTFSTKEIKAKVGDKITFYNDDNVTHNVFSRSGGNKFTVPLQKPKQHHSIELKEAGKCEVRCAIHPRMKLVITVED